MTRRQMAIPMVLAIVAGGIVLAAAAAQDADPDAKLAKADKLFDQKNYKEAADAYQAMLSAAPKHAKWHHANKRIILCRLRLNLFDPALEAAEAYIGRCKGTAYEARAERLAGNLYMLVPHWGTRAGGTFHRAQWMQGIRLRCERYDKGKSVAHLQRARDLYARYDGDARSLAELPADERDNWHNERIECIFDLAGACSRFGIYENSWRYWQQFWGQRDDFTAETAGEKDFDEYYSDWQLRRKRPVGLRIDADGKPIFPFAPKAYASDLDDDQKILYLLAEARDLDRTDNSKYVGLSWLRQAMLARARFGMDRLNSCAGMYYADGKYPLQEDMKEFNPWEMTDSEALVLAGGKIRKVTLPKQFDVLAILKQVTTEYPKSGVADEAGYAIGLYHQSRQQYVTALDKYAALKKAFPTSEWSNHANAQIQRIEARQVRISQTGVQLPAAPAEIQVSYRNVSKIWFVARRIDHVGFMNALRDEPITEGKGMRGIWSLGSWSYYFTQDHGNNRDWVWQLAGKYVGKEVARWSDEVKDDGTHRYAHTTLQTPLKAPGAYLIYAYTSAPPADHAEKTGLAALKLGNSRAVAVLTDLAIVEKPTEKGKLYMICGAVGGKPVPEAKVDVLEYWSTYDRKARRSIYHKQMHHLVTDADGLAVLAYPTDHSSQLHALVTAGEGRTAWTGMSYYSRYSPSGMRKGVLAYCITDRPVYRPAQQVRYKVWARQMDSGVLQNVAGRSFTLRVYDPRGNKVHEAGHRADQFGGFDGQLTLGEEPTLGVYRIQISSANYVGGQTFRVEEYKKPEFEVTVEPGKSQVKLGDKLTAVIKATYYFGGPVTDATVNYKVFREEYRCGYIFPGEWDWLYGAGYGWGWYDHDWFPWWGKVSCCRVAPPWWLHGWGRSPASPVRELVKQGAGAIGPDGTVKVQIDTAPALRDHGDRDHRYVIQAEVRDASRRVITGEGSVKVTRQAYYAMVQPRRSYYRPGEEMSIRIRCLTPDNKPVRTQGVITVSSVVFGGPENARIAQKELKRWPAKTDETGTVEFPLRYEKSGQLRITWTSPDTWGGVVEGDALVWVCGRDFDGKLYRFNDLELLTDKRTYRPGETAHVMINTKHSDSYVLLATEVDNNHLLTCRMLHLPKRHMVVDIPITKHSQPNFFIEATTVADLRTHQQALQICVPPEEGVIKLAVSADKGEYRPGEKATVHVTAKTLDGKPAKAQIAISAFDKSVLYIQGETAPEIARFFHGRLRHHSISMRTSLLEQFSAWGYVHRPFQQLQPYPQAWWGIWGPRVRDWRTVSDGQLQTLAYGNDKGVEKESRDRQAAEPVMGPADALRNAAPGALMAAKAASGLRELGARADRAAEAGGGGGGDEGLAEAEVRTKFADTALWVTTLTTDADGTATATFKMPENLTTWKINAWGVTDGVRVGQDSAEAITTKNLIVRLQGPRFFMERDEVVISANVNNYLEAAKTAKVSLDVPEKYLKLIGDTPAVTTVKVPAGGGARVDWRVKVLSEGVAKITVKALTDEESDAMAMTFPVLVHGITKQVAATASMRPDEKSKSVTIQLDVPRQRRPELTRLEVRFAPSLVGAMMDALPYCLDYPYGCTEQTMSRFLPAVLTRKTLQNMGIDLEDVRKIRGRMDEIRRVEKGEHRTIYADSPIFDSDAMDAMIKKGLARIANMQRGDGGWGWWTTSDSSGYLTSYVLNALCEAQRADVAVSEQIIGRGMDFLRRYEIGRMRDKGWSPHAQHAFVAYVLSLKKVRCSYDPPKDDKRSGDLLERLWTGRDKLGLYGKALLAMALANIDKTPDRANTVLQNIQQYKMANAETEVVWYRTPRAGWWYWWNNDIETNAWILRAITRLDPKSDIAPKLVKWLLNNRRNGYYWRSTRDTTLCVSAISDFVVASGEGKPDYTLTIDFDNGKSVKKVKIDKDSFFTFDNRFVLSGVAIGGGRHTLKITKDGPGALYLNTYLRYFTKAEGIKAAGHELKVDRKYFKLVQIPYEVEVMGADGQKLTESRLRYKRVPVADGDTVASGETVQVELKVSSDNDYTYLCFEDMKPAGFEPTEVRSGGKGQEGFASYMELRDEKVVFFVNAIGQGEHLLRYRLRAEVPGIFHALPTTLYGMYVPELRANSDEQIIKVKD